MSLFLPCPILVLREFVLRILRHSEVLRAGVMPYGPTPQPEQDWTLPQVQNVSCEGLEKTENKSVSRGKLNKGKKRTLLLLIIHGSYWASLWEHMQHFRAHCHMCTLFMHLRRNIVKNGVCDPPAWTLCSHNFFCSATLFKNIHFYCRVSLFISIVVTSKILSKNRNLRFLQTPGPGSTRSWVTERA